MSTNTIDFENLTWISNWHELSEEEKQETREMFKKSVEEAEAEENAKPKPQHTKEDEQEWFKKGYEMSQMDDLEKADEDPEYMYISCLEEALCCVGGINYDWQEKAFTRGYISGC